MLSSIGPMIYLSVINDRDNIVCYSAFATFIACVLTFNHCDTFIVIYWSSIGILTWEGQFVLDQTIPQSGNHLTGSGTTSNSECH